MIPKLNPTVAIAEKDSNRHGMSGSSSMMLSAMAQVMPSPVYMKKIAIAVATMSGMIRRFEHFRAVFSGKNSSGTCEEHGDRRCLDTAGRGSRTSAD